MGNHERPLEAEVTRTSRRPPAPATPDLAAFPLQEQLGNRATTQALSLLQSTPAALGDQLLSALPPADIALDPEQPWLYDIKRGTPTDAARELYGADLSPWESSQQVFR